MDVSKLSHAQCIILAATLASESSIGFFEVLAVARRDILRPELCFRILLTFLPETLEPSLYTGLVKTIASLDSLHEKESDTHIDYKFPQGLSEQRARAEIQKLHLIPIRHSSTPKEVTTDTLALFLIHRAQLIDAKTSLTSCISTLFKPFLGQSQYLQHWFISNIIPLTRINYDYYPPNDAIMELRKFESLEGSHGIQVLLSRSVEASKNNTATTQSVSRDFRGIVGPWTYGSTIRKRRRLAHHGEVSHAEVVDPVEITESDVFEDWNHAFEWIVHTAAENFSFAVKAIDGWDGPNDIDLGDYNRYSRTNESHEKFKSKLRLNYCQAIYASVYAAEQDTAEAIEGAHALLVRLADLQDFEPPPDLSTSVELLPRIEKSVTQYEGMSKLSLELDALLTRNHQLTDPQLKTFSLLQLFVYSSYLLASIGYNVSVSRAAKLRFWSDELEQLNLLQKILLGLVNRPRVDESQWLRYRQTIIWLWDWGILDEPTGPKHGYGIFGKIERDILEKEILKAICTVPLLSLATDIYLKPSVNPSVLQPEQIESVVLNLAFHHYDNASNGNRTRGGIKKASDLISTFRQYFPQSSAFLGCSALLAATHALSFYSLTLQHGVPFQPVSIRVNDDPIILVEKVFSQNPGSYAKLDDLIDIGRNLTLAKSADQLISKLANHEADYDEPHLVRMTERRVIGAAIKAALAEDDFETAYSYVVNKFNPQAVQRDPTSPEVVQEEDGIDTEDDHSWRAAFDAGRYRSVSSSSAPTQFSAQVRRLEQRMDLLSMSLMLAPAKRLPDVLAAWRRCEEELLTVLAQEEQDEAAFDDSADRRDVHVPGSFLGDAPSFMIQPRRKEMGRGAAEEAPMGLFDVARGAAAALTRNAGALRGPGSNTVTGAVNRTQTIPVDDGSNGHAGGSRVRKRDMVTNAVTGGLASGIGWMLGASPVKEQS